MPFLLQAVCAAGTTSALADFQGSLGKLIGSKCPDLAPLNMEYLKSSG